MTEGGENQWYAHKKSEDKTLGPYTTSVEALAVVLNLRLSYLEGDI